MGVNCSVYLPPGANLRYVAAVMARALGREARQTAYGYPEVTGVRVEPSSVPEMPVIVVEGPNPALCRYPDFRAYYHYDLDSQDEHARRYLGGTCLVMRSTPLACAVADRVVSFFGGTVEYADTAVLEHNVRIVLPREPMVPPDTDAWFAFQQKIAEVEPLTPEEVEARRHLAGYD